MSSNSSSKFFINTSLFILFFAQLIYSQNTNDYSLLWKIEGNGLTEPSYLFGTMHVEDKRAFNFSDQVLPAIEQSEKFALEIHPDSIMSFVKTMTNGKTPGYLKIKSVLKDKEYKKIAKRYFEVNNDSIENSNITDVETLISQLLKENKKKDDNQVFVDLHLLSQARTMSKTIVGLENQNNYLSFDSLSAKKQRKYILSYLKYDTKSYNEYLEKLKKIYISGDLEAVNNYLEKNKGYNKELTRRNTEMANNIALISKNSTLFAAVGVAHLPGKTGIIKLLSDMGYKVTKVNAEFTGVAKTYKVDKNLANWNSYKNDSLAFSIKVPGYLASTTKDLDYNYAINIASGHSYMFFAVDDRENYDPENKEKFYTNYLNNFKSKQNVVHDTIIDFKYKDLKGYELQLKTLPEQNETHEYYILKILTNNGITYFYGAFGKESILEDINTKKFFDSFNILKTYPLIKRDNYNNWKKFISKEGAFTVNVPGDYTDFSRKSELNQDGEILVYDLKLFMSTDKESNDNFLFRYNDLPLGYRLENLNLAYDEMENTLLQTASHLSVPKNVLINGLPGKEYELLIKEKYHAIAKVVFRGNRMYLLMHQKLDSNQKADANHKFFNSFKFLPFEKAELTILKEDFFEYKNYTKFKKESSETAADSYLSSSNEIESIDTLTGNAYSLNYSKLKPYFKTDTLSVFYEKTIKEYESTNEIITHKKHTTFNGINAIDFELTTVKDSIMSKHRLWLDQGYYFLASIYPSEETIENKNINNFLSGYKPLKKLKHNSIYEQKAKKIFKNLKNKDSLKRYSALNAFDYYYFDKSEIQTLHKILKYNYKDSLFQNEVISKVNNEFSTINNKETLLNLNQTYLHKTTSAMNKQDILYTIQSYKPDKYIETYNNLLFNHTPISEETYSYALLTPYRDSTKLIFLNFDKLVELANHKPYRSSVLDLFTEALNTDSLKNNVISQNHKNPLKFLEEDAQNYFEELNKIDYPETELISTYLNYFSALSPTKVNLTEFDSFFNKILNSKSYPWIKSAALKLKINHNLEVSDTIKKAVLDSVSNPLSILKLYESRNEINEIPEAYLTTEFTKLSVKQYLYDNDEFTDDYIFETPFQFKNQMYQPVILTYPNYDEKYILIVQLKDSIYNKEGKIEAFPCDTIWDTFDETYKEKSLNLVKNSENFE